MRVNDFYIGDAIKVIASEIPDNSVDLTITSPPYDKLRNYKGFIFDFENLAWLLYQITKEGGTLIWVIGDETKNGCETNSSFHQALYFKKIGFNLLDTMIYSKGAQGGAKGSKYCYTQSFEYMFVFTKGKIKTVNLLKDRENKYPESHNHSSMRRRNGKTIKFSSEANKFSKRTNVWELRGGYMVGSADKETFLHPATFPEQLANDHILSWSNEGDLIFDPMCGSGTVCKMAWLNKRNFVGIDISEEYINEICVPRLEKFGWFRNNKKSIL